MDQKALIKKALGKIKGLAMKSTAARFKAKADAKKAPPEEKKTPEPKEPETKAPPAEELETEEEDEGDDIMKKTTLITMTRGGASKEPVKRKPGRPKKS